MKLSKIFISLLFTATVVMTGCLSQSFFDDYVYKESISVKVDAINLMGKAAEDYATHQKDVEQLIASVQKIYEYEKGRPKNVESIKMWEAMLNPDKNLLAGFMKRWEDKGKMGKVFVTEAQKQITQAFDIIIGLETNKLKKENVNSFLAN